MYWIDGLPQRSISISHLEGEDVLKIVSVPHTPYLCCLTSTTVHLVEQHSLLPVTYHRRKVESLKQYGFNINIKTKIHRVKSCQLETLKYTNVMVLTDKNCIKIYQIVLSKSKGNDGIFEVNFVDSNDILQNSLPIVSTSNNLGIMDYVKQATKLIMGGGDQVPVENLEHFNNCAIDDEKNNYDINKVRISPYRMFRLTMEIDDYWLKSNSHDLILYNEKPANGGQEDMNNDNNVTSDTLKRMHYIFETINLKTSHAVTVSLKDCPNYPFHEGTRLLYVTFDVSRDQFLILNEKNELWILRYDESKSTFNSKLAFQFNKDHHKDSQSRVHVKFALNSKYSILIVALNNEIHLLKGTTKDHHQFTLLKKFTLKIIPKSITWSPNDEFFITIGQQYFRIFTKFGSCTFSSRYIKNEVDQIYHHSSEAQVEVSDWLTPKSIIVSDNSLFLYIQTQERLYEVTLLTSIVKSDLFINSRYISLINGTNKFLQFPLPTSFLPVIRQLETYHHPHHITHVGNLVCKRNSYNQLSISYGNHLAVLTPFSSRNVIEEPMPRLQQTNQALWLNFNSHFTTPFNIIDHFWFEDYLVLINRVSMFEEDNDDKNDDETELIVDEIIVLNTTHTRFAIGGEPVDFDTDLILWRHNFGNWFQSVELMHKPKNDSGSLVIQSNDKKVIILELSLNKHHGRSSSSTDLQQQQQQQEDAKDYKIFVGLNRTIHINNINSKIPLDEVTRLSLIKESHMLFHLNSGELYFLKHKLAQVGNQKNIMHEMVKIADCVESFELSEFHLGDEIVEYLCIRSGEAQVLVYDLDNGTNHLIILKDKRIVDDVMFYPFRVHQRQLSLIGIETASVAKGNYVLLWNNILYQHILYKFVESELRSMGDEDGDEDLKHTYSRYKGFPSFDHNLEILLYEQLTTNNDCTMKLLLRNLVSLIQLSPNGDSIFINCLRKIEIDYWSVFFNVLNTTPHEYMKKLITNENVELCYRFLIVYLNYKKEDGEFQSSLDSNDRNIILAIITMLDKYHKWEWCFELCRFIKLLDPTDGFLHEIRRNMTLQNNHIL